MKPQATLEPPRGDHWGRWFAKPAQSDRGGGSFSLSPVAPVNPRDPPSAPGPTSWERLGVSGEASLPDARTGSLQGWQLSSVSGARLEQPHR